MSLCTARVAPEKAVFRPALPLHFLLPEFTGERMTTYREQYLHPAWQKKRLEVMEEHGFACAACDATEKTLHVHHKQYVKGRKVWEYGNDELTCLCEECHQLTHEQKTLLEAELGKLELFEFPGVHALLVGFRNGLVESEGAPARYADSTLIPHKQSSLHYWVGQFARYLSEDLEQQEVLALYRAFRGCDATRLLQVIEAECNRHLLEFAEQAKNRPLDDMDDISA